MTVQIIAIMENLEKGNSKGEQLKVKHVYTALNEAKQIKFVITKRLQNCW